MTGFLDREEVVQCSERLVSCVVNGFKADINDWLKGVIVFGRTKDHSVKEVDGFKGVWKRMVIAVAKIPACRKFSSELCQGRHPPNLAQLCNSSMQEWLNIDVVYIQKSTHSCHSCISGRYLPLGTIRFSHRWQMFYL